MLRKLAVLFVVFCCLLGQLQAKDLKVLRVSPMGDDVISLRQITFTFNQDVVAIGKMERLSDEIPINITPNVNCQWRWISRSILACQLSEEDQLKKATKYKIKILPGDFGSQDAVLKYELDYQFITQRPKVNSYIYFDKWINTTKPAVKIYLNQEVEAQSLEKYLFFKSNSKRYQIDVKKSKYNSWIISPKENFDPNSKIEFYVEPGIKSVFGDELSTQSQLLRSFYTYDEPKLVGLKCYDNKTNRFKNFDLNNLGKCSPNYDIELLFNSPVFNNDLFRNVSVVSKSDKKLIIKNPQSYERHKYHKFHDINTKYALNLPIKFEAQGEYEINIAKGVNLKSLHLAKTKLDNKNKIQINENLGEKRPNIFIRIWNWIKSLFGFDVNETSDNIGSEDINHEAQRLTDIFYREFKEDYNFTIKMSDYKPALSLKYRNIILEKNNDNIVLFNGVNLDRISINYDYITKNDSGNAVYNVVNKALEKNKHQNLDLGIRQMLQGKSGVINGRIITNPETCKYKYCKEFSAQVTPYNILAKIGHFNSMIWVSDLASGKSVEDAEVELFIAKFAGANIEKKLPAVKTDKNGIAVLNGSNNFNWKFDNSYRYRNDNNNKVFIKVSKNDDIAILPVSYEYLIDAYRISGHKIHVNNKQKHGHVIAWGMTTQGVYKKGDEVSYKLYFRNHSNNKLELARRKNYKIIIKDPRGQEIYKKENVKLSEFATFNDNLKIKKSAISGWYQMYVESNYNSSRLNPLKFLVSDFSPAPFRVSNVLNGNDFYQGSEVVVDSFAKLHSGGPYGSAKARIIAKIKERQFTSNHALAAGFKFDSYNSYHNKEVIFSKNTEINTKGQLRNSFKINKSNIYFGKLEVESAIMDDRGKNISSNSVGNYFGVKRFVGLKSDKFFYKTNKPAQVKFVVVDEKGDLVDNSKVDIDIEYEDVKAIKVKSGGNGFVNKYIKKWVNIDKCQMTSSSQDVGICKFTPTKSGSYKISAKTYDEDNKVHKTTLNIWSSGSDWVSWQQPNDNSLVIIAKSKKYNIGQKAQFLIKNPYPNSEALITIERYGIIKKWTQKLEGNLPIIEFDIEPEFLPGFYLSVSVMSKRTDKPISDNGLDLGKPGLKMGYLKVLVDDPYKKINVDIKTDKEVYKPGEKVEVKLQANSKAAKNTKYELSAIVIDEALFDMIQGGKNYYDLYHGLNKLGDLDVNNFNLIQRLIGRQKIEKKGANPGGGAMAAMKALRGLDNNNDSSRNNFAYISYFNPNIISDQKGQAQFSFNIPDNLTGWKILILATNKGDLLGLGEKNIKSSLDIEIRPIMPNQVRQDDKFNAGFNVINKTNKTQKINVVLTANGDVKDGFKRITKDIEIEPYQRQLVSMNIETNNSGKILFNAKAASKNASDSMSHEINILPNRSLEVAANYGFTKKNVISEEIKFPKNIYDDVEKVDITLSPSVIGNIEGSFKYIKDYPYTCWEQKLTKAAMAANYNNLSKYLAKDFKWDNAKKLPQEILDLAYKFQAPNGGMTYFKAEDKYVSPYLSVYSALVFNWLRQENYEIDKNVEDKLHDYLLNNLLKRDIKLDYYTKEMAHSVRSMAFNVLAWHNKISEDDLLNYQQFIKEMDLFGKANFLQALSKTSDDNKLIKDLINDILSYSNQSGSKFSFIEEIDSSYDRILSSNLRTNCAILTSFLPLINKDNYHDLVKDVAFKLVRMITASRGAKAHFNNTQENIFCSNALVKYAKIYEKQTPNMSVEVKFNKDILGQGSLKSFRSKPVSIIKKIDKKDPGSKAKITISKEGIGQLYYQTRLSYAKKDYAKNRINAGIDIRREYSVKTPDSWRLLKKRDQIKRGDLVKVDIYLSLPSPRQFLVVDDPVISGLEPVNRDLANSSSHDANLNHSNIAANSWYFKFDKWRVFDDNRWGFYHKELGHDNVRFYSDYLLAGNYHLSYITQAISTGEFSVAPTHSEEMYDPDIYGKSLDFKLIIKDE